MLSVELDRPAGIAILEPDGALSRRDFVTAASIIDPFIEESGGLRGVIIHVRSFPGWQSFSSLVAHLKFARDHHRKVSRIAFATDSPAGELAEHIASHFVAAEIRHFAFSELEAAKKWILDSHLNTAE